MGDKIDGEIVGLHRSLKKVADEIEDRRERERFLDAMAELQEALEEDGVDFEDSPVVH